MMASVNRANWPTPMPYVIKSAVSDNDATRFSFRAQKTMYRGKAIRTQDEVFVFSSEIDGGPGLIARGIVVDVVATPMTPIGAKTRCTPRVSITVQRIASAKRPVGRHELKPFNNWNDGQPETELCFKLYRQATNKIVAISEDAAAFLRSHCQPETKRMKSINSPSSETASANITQRIQDLGDWRGTALAHVRKLIHAADPDVQEEWKWRGTPVWSHDGIICTGESYKRVVKLTFARGAVLNDPKKLFNSSLDGNTRRAIDLSEGDKINEAAFKQIIRAAVAANTAATAARQTKKKLSSK